MFRLLAFFDGRRLDREFLLIANTTYVLGRAEDAGLQTTWDERISRRHVEIQASGEGVEIRRLTDASNPVYFDGSEVTSASLSTGQSFVIGSSRFELQQVSCSEFAMMMPLRALKY